MKAHLAILLAGSMVALASTPARAFEHDYYTQMRSSIRSNVYVMQCVSGEYGRLAETIDGGEGENEGIREKAVGWQGFSLRSGIGVELKKFLRVTLAHSYVSLRARGADLERLEGSRIELDGRFVFAGPLFDLELGGGAMAARLDHQKDLDQSTMLGTGYDYRVGLSHFVTSGVSVFVEARAMDATYRRDSGRSDVARIDGTVTSASIGSSIWL